MPIADVAPLEPRRQGFFRSPSWLELGRHLRRGWLEVWPLGPLEGQSEKNGFGLST